MKKIILPLLLLIGGTGAGVGAGIFLAPPAAEPDNELQNPCGDQSTEEFDDTENETSSSDNEYAKLNNQFIVPIVDDGSVSALVVMSLSVEVSAGEKEAVFLSEPKLRDSFLQAMFDHANIGGFSGNFTSAQALRPLREDLNDRAKSILPDAAKNVLIVDIVRQDV